MQTNSERAFVLPNGNSCTLYHWDGAKLHERATLSCASNVRWSASIEHDLLCLYDPRESEVEVWRGYFTADPTRVAVLDFSKFTARERSSVVLFLREGVLFVGTSFESRGVPECVELENDEHLRWPVTAKLTDEQLTTLKPYKFNNIFLDDRRLLCSVFNQQRGGVALVEFDLSNPREITLQSMHEYPLATRDEDFHTMAAAGEFIAAASTGMGGYVCTFSFFARKTLRRLPPKLFVPGGQAGKYVVADNYGRSNTATGWDFWHVDGLDEQIALCADKRGVGLLDTRGLHPFPPMNEDASNEEIMQRNEWTANFFDQFRWHSHPNNKAAVRAYFYSPSHVAVSWEVSKNRYEVSTIEITPEEP